MPPTTPAEEKEEHRLAALQRAILDGAALAIISTDAAGVVQTFNRAAERMLGYSADEVVGRRRTDDFHDPEELRRDAEALTRASRTNGAVPPGIEAATLRARRGEMPERREWTWVRKDGTRFPVRLSLTALRDGRGDLAGFVGVAEDISERRASEERFRLMADAVPQIVWITDAQGRVEFFNRQWVEYTGEPSDPARPLTAADFARRFVHPEDEAPTMAAFREACAGAGHLRVEHRVRSAGGDYRWFLTQADPYRDPETGEVVRWFGGSVDIHDRKVAGEALRESEARYRTLFESVDEGFCILEVLLDGGGRPRDYRFVEVNPAFERNTGLVGAVGRTALEMVPGLGDFWIQTYGRVALTGEPARFESHEPAMGRWFDVYAQRVGAPEQRRVALLFNDITQRKAAEEATRLSEERFRLVAGVTSDAIWDWDLAAGSLWWNEGVQSLFGYAPADVPPTISWWYDHIHPDDRDRIVGGVHAVTDGDGANWVEEYRFRCADGSYATVLDRGRVVRDADRRAVRMLGAMQDVTEQRAAEARERFLADLLERTRTLSDPDAVLAEAETALASFLGASRVGYAEIDGAAETATIRREWKAPGLPSLVGVQRLDAYGEPVRAGLRRGETMVVGDAAADPRTAPAADAFAALGMRSFVSVPVTQGGVWAASLTVARSEARPWPAGEVELIEVVTERTRLALDNARLRREREAEARKNERIAETLQRSLLVAPDASRLSGVEVGTEYLAAWDEALIGGDFYDAFALDGGRVALVVGDATGKGLEAAEHIAEVKYALRAFLREDPDPTRALARLNEFACARSRLDAPDGTASSLVAVAAVVLDTKTGAASGAGAGMELPLVLRAGAGGAPGAADEIPARGPLIGVAPGMEYDAVAFELGPGDLLALFTDGLTEARQGGRQPRFFGPEGVEEALRAEAAAGEGRLTEAARAVVGRAVAFAGGKRQDDMCLLLARWSQKGRGTA